MRMARMWDAEPALDGIRILPDEILMHSHSREGHEQTCGDGFRWHVNLLFQLPLYFAHDGKVSHLIEGTRPRQAEGLNA